MPPDYLSRVNRSHRGLEDERGEVLGNPQEFLGHGIVCFLDLLGFTNAVLAGWGDGVDSALARFLRIKDSGAVTSPETGIVMATYSQDDDGTTVHGPTWCPRIHTASDSILVSIALPDKLKSTEFLCTVVGTITGAMRVWLTAIREGFTIRGAVEIGGVYWNESEIVGPAPIRAIVLEKCATTSRVLLGRNLINEILKWARDDNVPDYLVNQLLKFLVLHNDGLIGMNPWPFSDLRGEIERIKVMQEDCSEDEQKRSKYDELIAILESTERPMAPEIGDLSKSLSLYDSLNQVAKPTRKKRNPGRICAWLLAIFRA